MNLVFSIIIGIVVGIVVAWFGDYIGVPSPLPAIAGFVAFLLIAFYGRGWFNSRPL